MPRPPRPDKGRQRQPPPQRATTTCRKQPSAPPFAAKRPLRGALHAAWRRFDREATILSDHHVALMAPLWFEPGDRGARRWLRAAVFLLPALLFLAGVVLIGYGWTLATPPLLGGRLVQGAHGVLYLACAAAVLRMAIALRRTLASYSAAVAQEVRSLAGTAAATAVRVPLQREDAAACS
jgi:hypothetical protein